MKQVAAILLICKVAVQNALATRILGVFVHPATSNSLYTHAVMSTLAAAGHDVTVYSPLKPSSNPGFRHVHILTDFHKDILGTFNYEMLLAISSKSGFGCSLFRTVAHAKCDSFLKHPTVQQLLHSNESFDLVFTGASFGEESLLVFGHVFRAPTITLLPSGTWSAVDYLAGNAISLVFSPEYYAFPFTDRMSLVERLQNVFSGAACTLWYHWYDIPGHDAILQRHAASLSPPPPPVYQMVRDVALTFVNVHPSISYPKPTSPNIVMIGGIHIEEDSDSLPQDIQEVMDSAKDGVVFCSLGSIVPVEKMPTHLVNAYINAFKRLPQKIIWKISGENLPELPENVMVSSWLPQQKILEHPNLKLFLTHGGLGSQLEALRAGVPVVGLPFFSDQPHNVRLFEYLGVGVGLNLNTLSEETLTTALQTLLNDSRFAENARRVARIYADRPMEPKVSVVYWTNYVLKHGDAHLRPQAAVMPWYQRFLLDVALFVLLAVIFVLVLGYILVKAIFVKIIFINQKWKTKVE